MSHSSSWRSQPSSPWFCPSTAPLVKKMNVSNAQQDSGLVLSTTTKQHLVLVADIILTRFPPARDGFSKGNQQAANELFFQSRLIPGSFPLLPMKPLFRMSRTLYPHPTNTTLLLTVPPPILPALGDIAVGARPWREPRILYV